MHPLTQQRYTGCLATPPLWTGDGVSPFPQMELAHSPIAFEEEAANLKKYRLGKLAEAFVFQALKRDDSVSWICDNLQIQQDKRTVGEIDALFYHHGRPAHLEVAYKFYLYDTREKYEDPLAPWVGPNDKDRLVLKLNKLHQKQFPLLGSELGRHYLQEYGLVYEQLQQMLCFKGQLFLPYGHEEVDIAPLNPDCIAGSYLILDELKAFEDCTFYIPQKLDWLIRPHHQVPWLTYVEARKAIKGILDRKRSPMVWVKREEVVEKHFVVFW
jgi:hypothetical protein